MEISGNGFNQRDKAIHSELVGWFVWGGWGFPCYALK